MTHIHRITSIQTSVVGGRSSAACAIRVKDVWISCGRRDRAEILADYPYLEADDITAVLEFAARQSDHPVLRSA